jgi:hypothetical protein
VKNIHANAENFICYVLINQHREFPFCFCINHGLSRTVLANARTLLERKRKRGVSVLVSGLNFTK